MLTFECDHWTCEGDAETVFSAIYRLCRSVLCADSFCSPAYQHLGGVVVIDALMFVFRWGLRPANMLTRVFGWQKVGVC